MENNATPEKKSLSKSKKENKFRLFLLNHKVSVILVLAILVVFSWGAFKNYQLKRQFAKQQEELINSYESKMDSLKVANYKLTSKVFSWAIRSEMLRNNNEQVNQFFLSFIKDPNVKKIQLINPDNAMVVLSTDKKDEGQKIDMQKIYQTDSLTVVREDDVLKIYNPIMGLNKKIGLLVIEVANQKSQKIN